MDLDELEKDIEEKQLKNIEDHEELCNMIVSITNKHNYFANDKTIADDKTMSAVLDTAQKEHK